MPVAGISALFKSSAPAPQNPFLSSPGRPSSNSGRSGQNAVIVDPFAALRQRCWLRPLRYLSSTNLPVFVNLTYLTIKVRSWLVHVHALTWMAPVVGGLGPHSGRYNSMASVGNPATILLVDDDEAIRRFVRHILQQQGFRVIEACDGAAALKAASTSPPPVAFFL